MAIDKKKKFSFFDLSDDESFSSLEVHNEEPSKEESIHTNTIENIPTQQNTVPTQPLESLSVSQPIKEELKQPIEEKIIKEIHNNENDNGNSFYGKVEAFIPSQKKEEAVEVQEEVKLEPKVIIDQTHGPIQVKVQPQQQAQAQVVQPQPIQEQPNIQPIQNTRTRISDNSLNGFFDVKEKLDVKTNIYIKKWIYDEIEQIHKKTNISRSSVINKLLEHALKELK